MPNVSSARVGDKGFILSKATKARDEFIVEEPCACEAEADYVCLSHHVLKWNKKDWHAHLRETPGDHVAARACKSCGQVREVTAMACRPILGARESRISEEELTRGRSVQAQEALIDAAFGTDEAKILSAAKAFREANIAWLKAKGAIPR